MLKHSAAEASANNIYGVINEMTINGDQYNEDGPQTHKIKTPF